MHVNREKVERFKVVYVDPTTSRAKEGPKSNQQYLEEDGKHADVCAIPSTGLVVMDDTDLTFKAPERVRIHQSHRAYLTPSDSRKYRSLLEME